MIMFSIINITQKYALVLIQHDILHSFVTRKDLTRTLVFFLNQLKQTTVLDNIISDIVYTTYLETATMQICVRFIMPSPDNINI